MQNGDPDFDEMYKHIKSKMDAMEIEVQPENGSWKHFLLPLTLVIIGVCALIGTAFAKQTMPDVIQQAHDAMIEQEIRDRKAAKRYTAKDRKEIQQLIKKVTK